MDVIQPWMYYIHGCNTGDTSQATIKHHFITKWQHFRHLVTPTGGCDVSMGSKLPLHTSTPGSLPDRRNVGIKMLVDRRFHCCSWASYEGWKYGWYKSQNILESCVVCQREDVHQYDRILAKMAVPLVLYCSPWSVTESGFPVLINDVVLSVSL